MLRFQRSAMTRLGRMPQAARFGLEIRDYMKANYGIDVQVFATSNGRMYWFVDYADYTTFGEVRSKVNNDEGYWEIIRKAVDLFVEDSVEDHLLTPIS